MDNLKTTLSDSAKTAKFTTRKGTWNVEKATDGTLNLIFSYDLVFNIDTPGDSEAVIVMLASLLRDNVGGNLPGNLPQP